MARKTITALLISLFFFIALVPSSALAGTDPYNISFYDGCHTLYLHGNGGTWDGGVETLTVLRYAGAPTFTLTGAVQPYPNGDNKTLSRPGYTFVGWKGKADNTAYQTFDTITITKFPQVVIIGCVSDMNLYAQWEETPAGDTSVTTAAAPADPTTAITVTTPDETIQVSIPDSANTAETVILSYDANGGVGLHVDFNVEKNSYTVVNSVLDRQYSWEGYTFLSWNTKADGTGITYNPNDNLLVESDITLYAQWKANVVKENPLTGDNSIGLVCVATCALFAVLCVALRRKAFLQR